MANAETLAEMQAQLAVIDETYFTEERLAEILENINESQEINATKLNGFPSSNFAKVSQLSNYAPVSHNHSISQITGLYDYQITASKYNVDIDTDVTITVKVTNRATGRPVTGVTVPVLKNNSTWKSGTTGVNGTFQLTYTADTWGLTMFSANNSSTFVNIVEPKLSQHITITDSTYDYSGTYAKVTITGSVSPSGFHQDKLYLTHYVNGVKRSIYDNPNYINVPDNGVLSFNYYVFKDTRNQSLVLELKPTNTLEGVTFPYDTSTR